MSVSRRMIAVVVLAMLLIGALVLTALQTTSGNGTQTASKAGGVVAVVADAKAKE